MSRCTGHCCKHFFLPATPGMLALIGRAASTGRGDVTELPGGKTRWSCAVQSIYTRGRLSFASAEEAVLVAGMVEHIETRIEGLHTDGHFYRCRNLLPNGDCGIYETRPTLCQGFPYDGNECDFEACTWRRNDGAWSVWTFPDATEWCTFPGADGGANVVGHLALKDWPEDRSEHRRRGATFVGWTVPDPSPLPLPDNGLVADDTHVVDVVCRVAEPPP